MAKNTKAASKSSKAESAAAVETADLVEAPAAESVVPEAAPAAKSIKRAAKTPKPLKAPAADKTAPAAKTVKKSVSRTSAATKPAATKPAGTRPVGVNQFREGVQQATKLTLTPGQAQKLLTLAARHFGVLNIHPGQVWKANDERRGTRRIQIIDVAAGRVKVRNIDTEVISEVAASSFNLGARGFSLIES